jgi:uncharacterized protein (TIGR02118 family)
MSKFAVIFGEGEQRRRPSGSRGVGQIPGFVRATRNDVVDIVHREHIARAVRSVLRLDELWCDGTSSERTLDALHGVYGGLPVIQISEVRETAILDRPTNARADESPLVKRLSLLQRKADLSRASFCAYWRDVHAAMVSCHRHVARYVQNHVVDDSRGMFDGIAEFQITDLRGMRADYESEAAKAMKADVQNFAATISTYVVRAHAIH